MVLSPPLVGTDGTLYVALNTKGDVYAGGNRLVGYEPDGGVKAGWPVTLVEEGAWFYTFAVADDGTVFAYAIEPAGRGTNSCGGTGSVYSGTIVALDDHGDSIYTTTLVLP